jgi:hypothetical protein
MAFITTDVSIVILGSLALQSAEHAASTCVNRLDIVEIIYRDHIHRVILATDEKNIFLLNKGHESRLPGEFISVLRHIDVPRNAGRLLLSR